MITKEIKNDKFITRINRHMSVRKEPRWEQWKDMLYNRDVFKSFLKSLDKEEQKKLFNNNEFIDILLDMNSQNVWADTLISVNKETVTHLFNKKIVARLIKDKKVADRKFNYAKYWISKKEYFDVLFTNADTQTIFTYEEVISYISEKLNSANQLQLLKFGLTDEKYNEYAWLIFKRIGGLENITKLCKNIDYKNQIFNNSNIMCELPADSLSFLYEDKEWGSLTQEQKRLVAITFRNKPIKAPNDFLLNPQFYEELVKNISLKDFNCLLNNFVKNNLGYEKLVDKRKRYLRNSLDELEQKGKLSKNELDHIFELFFGDSKKNSILMMKMILDSSDSFDDVKSIIGKENLDLFAKIVNNEKCDSKSIMAFYAKLKMANKDFSETLYDGFSKARECFERDVNKHLLSSKPSSVLSGQDFCALVSCQKVILSTIRDMNNKDEVKKFVEDNLTTLLSNTTNNNNNAISCSLIDQEHTTMFAKIADQPLIFGYDKIIEGSLMHANRCDSFSNPYHNFDDSNPVISEPVSIDVPDYVDYDEFMKRTARNYNEIKLKQVANATFRGREVFKPTYILVLDEILPIHEEFARQLQIPLIVLHTEAYVQRQKKGWTDFKTEDEKFERIVL